MQALLDTPAWTLPTFFVVNPLRPRPPLDLERQVESLAARRAQQRAETLARIAAHYAPFDGAAWRKRFQQAASGKGPPLRVLGITTRYSTVLRYSIGSGNSNSMFAINTNDGTLSVAGDLNITNLSAYALGVIVSDQTGSTPLMKPRACR